MFEERNERANYVARYFRGLLKDVNMLKDAFRAAGFIRKISSYIATVQAI